MLTNPISRWARAMQKLVPGRKIKFDRAQYVAEYPASLAAHYDRKEKSREKPKPVKGVASK